jgi:hypothetical protein
MMIKIFIVFGIAAGVSMALAAAVALATPPKIDPK